MDIKARRVEIEYTNYRGERGRRVIVPTLLYFGSTPWHTEPQWLLSAYDVAKGAARTFAMRDIHDWVDVKEAVE